MRNAPQLITYEHAAHLMGTSTQVMCNIANTKGLKKKTIGKRVYLSQNEVEKYVAKYGLPAKKKILRIRTIDTPFTEMILGHMGCLKGVNASRNRGNDAAWYEWMRVNNPGKYNRMKTELKKIGL
jgi:hypothetical protein